MFCSVLSIDRVMTGSGCKHNLPVALVVVPVDRVYSMYRIMRRVLFLVGPSIMGGSYLDALHCLM